MKIVICILILSIFFNNCNNKLSNKHNKVHHRHKQVDFNQLQPTPKGLERRMKSVALKSDDPDKVKLYTVDWKGDYTLQEIDRKILNRVTMFCNKPESITDQFCGKIKECDICTMSTKCGWCEKSGQCLSAGPSGALCPEDCLQNWVFHTKQCRMTVKAGKLGNWAPEASSLINAQQIDNTGKIRVNYIEPAYFVQESQVQIGVSKKKDVNHKVNIKYDGQNERDEKISLTPLYGKQVIRVPLVNNRISSQMIDMNTGEIIPPIQKIEPKITHGIDDGQDMQNHGKDKK